MSSTSAKPILFYDIAFKAPRESTNCAPNPWKSRLALNFKGVPYSTIWVPLPDVEKVRRSVKVPACRKFGDGSDYLYLSSQIPTPMRAVGDSFDIAVYLQKTYPDSGSGELFPEQKLDYEFTEQASGVPLSEMRRGDYEEYARFNKNVDAVFSAHVILMLQGMLLEPAGSNLIIGGWLRMASKSLPQAEWEALRSWHGGVFGQLRARLTKDEKPR
ncbi:unnamed protein product [Aureobasidium pullulans]|nr:unnamed protein product [Aureobasidium pullulans]